MSNDKDVNKISFIKRRILLIKIFYGTLISLLIGKLAKLQIIDNLKYIKLAKNNSIREDYLIPDRGIIFDRNNKIIGNNTIGYKLLFISNSKDITHNLITIKKAYNILNRKQSTFIHQYDYIKRKITNKINQRFILAKNLTQSEIIRLNFNLVYLDGIHIERYSLRNYPYNKYTSSLIGNVIRSQNIANKKLLLNSDYRVGNSGIEKYFETTLGGKIGVKQVLINVSGKKINEEIIVPSYQGKSLKTTINQELQTKLSNMMENNNGSAVLIDVRNGDILAMCSVPNIDPNLIAKGLSDEEWEKFVNNNESYGILLDKNISSTYPPGSTFKIISSLTAIKNGWDVNKKVNCTGEYKIGNRVFHCWIAQTQRKQHGFIDLNTAIAQSCNCYFYHLSEFINNEDIYEMAKKMGLGTKLLDKFDCEVEGFIPNEKWKRQRYHQPWFPGDNANFVMGQGYTHITPLQLAIMTARVATNREIKPRYICNEKFPKFNSLGLNDEELVGVRRGLYSVINEPYGIIYGICSKKYQICGKTGSAQVVSTRIDNKDMRSGKVEKKKHSHALFTGYAPFDNPRYAVAVVVEHGIGGARSAAPVGTRILAEAIDIEKNN